MNLLMTVATIALLFAAAAVGLSLLTFRTVRSIEASFPPVGRFVEVPGARLHVVERGQGPALLLVHGLAAQLGHYTYAIVDQLAKRYRVVAVDRPGSGYSVRAPGTSATFSAQADALAALIDALQLGRPVVAGHSLGGAVALTLAQRHPERVGGLALIAPLTHPFRRVPAAFRALAIAKPAVRNLLAWTIAVPLGLAIREKLLKLVFDPEAVPNDYATRGRGLVALRPSHLIAAAADFAAIRESMPAMLKGYGSLKLPVSILFGLDDRVLDPRAQGQALAQEIGGAQLTLVKGGHMLPITAPEQTAQFIGDAAARSLH